MVSVMTKFHSLLWNIICKCKNYKKIFENSRKKNFLFRYTLAHFYIYIYILFFEKEICHFSNIIYIYIYRVLTAKWFNKKNIKLLYIDDFQTHQYGGCIFQLNRILIEKRKTHGNSIRTNITPGNNNIVKKFSFYISTDLKTGVFFLVCLLVLTRMI